jgi:hypothetical protein
MLRSTYPVKQERQNFVAVNKMSQLRFIAQIVIEMES